MAAIDANGILLLAAENGALPNGKVGGLGDVIRELPRALAHWGLAPSVLVPAYGVFASLPGARQLATVEVSFADTTESVVLYEIEQEADGVRHLVLDHARFAPQSPGRIYCDDPDDGPFATDAGKFAFFCASAATALRAGVLPRPAVVHAHDWPAALYFLLRAYDPAFAALAEIRTVFTIHNLALQGVRPLAGDASSLETWFPSLEYDENIVTDPRWRDCVNPLAAAIRLADKVSTVSPTYANEILEPNAPARGFFGGEGLEAELAAAAAGGRLIGILNGCSYPRPTPGSPDWVELLERMRRETKRWLAQANDAAPDRVLAASRLDSLTARRPGILLTSVGRVGSQKTGLFREPVLGGVSALAAILRDLGERGLLIMVGSGEPEYERFLAETALEHSNFLYLRGYSDEVAESVYAAGDLFLMPSSFEPCGISQMLAMRAGQPCVVHGVGGLRDTVQDGETGFMFAGPSPRLQAEHFVATVAEALSLRESDPERWREIRYSAAASRFTWNASAAVYTQALYAADDA